MSGGGTDCGRTAVWKAPRRSRAYCAAALVSRAEWNGTGDICVPFAQPDTLVGNDDDCWRRSTTVCDSVLQTTPVAAVAV
jgi:hypothetical protein